MLDKVKFEAVKEEVKLAYADCNGNRKCDSGYDKRNLNYFCQTAVSPSEAVKIMKAALAEFKSEEYSYNDFRVKALNDFPKDAKIHIARESSVCVYVEDNVNVFIKYADEFSVNNTKGDFKNLSRYWWD